MTYYDQVFSGLGYTLGIFFLTLAISIPVGIALAALSFSKNRAVRNVIKLYTVIFTNIPLLFFLVLLLFGLPVVGLEISRLKANHTAFVLYYSAAFGEVFFWGLKSMERGQAEAGWLLGFSWIQIFLKIVLPQVWVKILPYLRRQVILLM